MTPEETSAFRENGCLLLRGALAKGQVEPLRKHVLGELKRLKVWASGKIVSAAIKRVPVFQQIGKVSGSIKLDDRHCEVIDNATHAAITALAGRSLLPAHRQFLVSLPNQGDWTLRGLSWHTDISPAGHRSVPGIQAFVLIDEVQRHGGATLAIAGSHRVADERSASARVREILRRREDPGDELRNLGLSIVEMSGRAGDVYLMDMRVLHTPSINATDRLRLMATVRYLASNASDVRGPA